MRKSLTVLLVVLCLSVFVGLVVAGTHDGTRWRDNEDGTVTDMTTGLVWLKDAKCTGNLAGIDNDNGYLSWNDAMVWSSAVKETDCGLSDGSVEGDWRLPTKSELMALTSDPEKVLSGTPRAFVGVQSSYYWSSATIPDHPGVAWHVHLHNGLVLTDGKSKPHYVWPVRGGQ